MKKIYVCNIQPFSLDDGDGIRTTVFLQGCNLHCPWCANPECIPRKRQYWFDKEKCVGMEDGPCRYSKMCSKRIAVTLMGTNIEGAELKCPFHALSATSVTMDREELIRIIKSQEGFYRQAGGVTFSGGEPLLQIYEYEDLLYALKKEKINLCVETALFVSKEEVELAITYFDFLYIDMKIMDVYECKKWLGGDIRRYKENIELVNKSGIKYNIRIPLVDSLTTNDKNLAAICSLLKQLKPEKVELLRVHALGGKKYQMLNQDPKVFACSQETAEQCKKKIKQVFDKVVLL